MAGLERLVTLLLDGDTDGAVTEAVSLRKRGIGIESIVTGGIETAMMQLDAKCTADQYNLLEIMLCGRAALSVLKELYPGDEQPVCRKGVVALASLEGDIHDLGKNMVKMILIATGFTVQDYGRDCPVERLVESAGEENLIAVGVSGLITTVIPKVRRVKEELTQHGLSSIPVVAGGAALKQASAEQLNVDYVAETAFDGLHFLNSLAGGTP